MPNSQQSLILTVKLRQEWRVQEQQFVHAPLTLAHLKITSRHLSPGTVLWYIKLTKGSRSPKAFKTRPCAHLISQTQSNARLEYLYTFWQRLFVRETTNFVSSRAHCHNNALATQIPGPHLSKTSTQKRKVVSQAGMVSWKYYNFLVPKQVIFLDVYKLYKLSTSVIS